MGGGDVGDTAGDTEVLAVSGEVKHVLKIFPGLYVPGTVPFGATKPLEGMNKVIERFEKLYPDTRVEIVNVPGLREYLVTQLSAGTAPDIFASNVEDVWQDTHKGWYIQLDGFLEKPNPFVAAGQPGSGQWWDMFKYEEISRGKAGPDGKMYCISLDVVETGIFYNKDIFAEVGVEVPETWSEWLGGMAKLREAGYEPYSIFGECFADWAVDLIFDQMYYGILEGIDVSKDTVREGYLQGYLDSDEICFLREKGFFGPGDRRWVELWRIIKEFHSFVGKGFSRDDVFKEFVKGRAAMTWDASWLVQKLVNDPDIDFEWGVFYLPRITKESSRYAGDNDMCVIGGAGLQLVVTNSAIKDTGDIETSERLERCIAFLQFLTMPENVDTVVNEILLQLPNVKGVQPRREMEVFDEILRRRYTTTKWTFTFDMRFNEILYRMLLLYLNDGIDVEGFLGWMERNLDSASKRISQRKELDFTEFEKRWQDLAPLRRDYEGLPEGAK